MCFVFEFLCEFLFISGSLLVNLTRSTIDINAAEYQYIADHLSEKECHSLMSALHFNAFEIPKEAEIAEERLPEEISCLDLLLHWNSTPKEGKGKTHLDVCHRLNQIGREDLAQWLSKTVYHKISQNLKVGTSTPEADEAPSFPSIVQTTTEEIQDEAAWTLTDSLLSILLVFGLAAFGFGSVFLLFLRCTRTYAETHRESTKYSPRD